MTWSLTRGRIYLADIGFGRKYFLVVSNNRRNGKLDSVLAVRITTTSKQGLPSAVQLTSDDSLTGWVCCDDIGPLFEEEVISDAGAVSARTMIAVNRALGHALGISQ